MTFSDPFHGLGGERTIIKPRLGRPVTETPDSTSSFEDLRARVGISSDLDEPQFKELLLQFKACPPASRNLLISEASPLLRLILLASSTGVLKNPALLAT
ncbi:MAG TPA: hypothetical protein VFV28_10975, partial [Limnobacter sp.]|nr:hypothetical protein [Limnobacter sp.]